MILRDKQVAGFIRRLQHSAPVDVVGIAKVLGLGVYESQDLPEGIAGKLFRDAKYGGQAQYSIVVRGADPHTRKRFTVAHELGHYLLHRHLIGSGVLVDDAMYRSHLGGGIEAQANALAADILMPHHLLERHSKLPLPELARLFEVSEQAMRIRRGQHQDEVESISEPADYQTTSD